MAVGAVDRMFCNIFEGCISICDSAIERRPYHKNCGCALHERSRGALSSFCHYGKSKIVCFPIRRSWSEGNSIALHLASASSSSSNLHSLSSFSSISTNVSLSSIASLAMSDVD